MPAGPKRDIAGPDEFAAAFDVSRETLAALDTYASILRHWQRAINLISPATEDQIWHRHFADSAQILALTPDARVWLDLGSGAGFPGMVVALLLQGRPGTKIHLVESNAKKVAFLREVARKTGAAVEIHGERIESLVDQRRIESVDVVTARALAPLGKLIGYAQPFLGPATVGVFLKGREVEAEIAAARQQWRFAVRLVESITDAYGRIAVVSAVEPVETR